MQDSGHASTPDLDHRSHKSVASGPVSSLLLFSSTVNDPADFL
jgi:hypothetical protein